MKLSSDVKHLITLYNQKKHAIKKRLKDFSRLHRSQDEDIFKELCFCLLTPQSKAVYCDKAITELCDRGLLLKGADDRIRPCLKGRARFHNRKATYIVNARKAFQVKGRIRLKDTLDLKDPIAAREWLVENIKGLGYKEASHFLRNIGLGKDLAILDRHILKNLKKYGAIDKIPSSIGTRKNYLSLEEKVKGFAKKIRIPLEELDLLFWSIETGYIFK